MTTCLFFYSNYCQHCKKITNLLKSSKIQHSIKPICVDTSEVRSKIPKYVKSVPCLILGQSNQILVGKEIIDWIQFQEKASPMNNAGDFQKAPSHARRAAQGGRPNGGNGGNGEPGAWHLMEMSNFSDNYSFIDADTSAQGDGGFQMSHNFEVIGSASVKNAKGPGNARSHNTGRQTSGAPPGAPSMPVSYDTSTNPSFGALQNTMPQSQLDKQMQDYMSKREMDHPNVPARIG